METLAMLFALTKIAKSLGLYAKKDFIQKINAICFIKTADISNGHKYFIKNYLGLITGK
jgi:hypothetical protein